MVVEMVMPAGNDPSPASSFDLLMLLANEEGRVRTEAEFRDLFAAAGLRLARVDPDGITQLYPRGRARIASASSAGTAQLISWSSPAEPRA